jgi:two-component system chemotaxis response regulator CheY
MLNGEVNVPQLPRLLVVEDNDVERMIICRSGFQSGFDVDVAATLLKARQLLCEREFDCATIDLSLGADCGLRLLQTLSAQEHLIPVIVISSACQKMLEMTAEMAKSLGFDSHIMSKPLNLIELRDVLDGHYRNTSIRRSLHDLSKTAALKSVERQVELIVDGWCSSNRDGSDRR